jgi:hypothetical protein
MHNIVGFERSKSRTIAMSTSSHFVPLIAEIRSSHHVAKYQLGDVHLFRWVHLQIQALRQSKWTQSTSTDPRRRVVAVARATHCMQHRITIVTRCIVDTHLNWDATPIIPHSNCGGFTWSRHRDIDAGRANWVPGNVIRCVHLHHLFVTAPHTRASDDCGDQRLSCSLPWHL